jgi:hypothetical protein
MHRILHVGLGPLGIKIATDLAQRRLGSIVAAVDPAPTLVGKDLSTLAPGAASTKIVSSLEEVRNWSDIQAALVTTSSDLRLCAPTFRELLRRGLPIVSTCEELVYPWLRHPELSKELHELAVKHGGRLLGTGVNPGFLMDALPVFATAVSKSVQAVQVYRIQDATTRRIPFQKKIGATLDDAEFQKRVAAGTLRHVGLGESLHFIAHYLGFKIDRWNEDIGPVKTDRDLTCALGPIPKGRISGVRQTADGYSGDRRVIRIEFQAAIGQADPHDRVVIEGEPPMDLTFRGGVHGDIATSAIALNSIAPLMEAKPGLHTMATVPMVHWANAAKAPR